MDKYGHRKLRKMLLDESRDRPASASDEHGDELVFQYSSIGSLDPKWLYDEFCDSCCASAGGSNGLNRERMKNAGTGLHLIWPTVDEVRNSVEGYQVSRS